MKWMIVKKTEYCPVSSLIEAKNREKLLEDSLVEANKEQHKMIQHISHLEAHIAQQNSVMQVAEKTTLAIASKGYLIEQYGIPIAVFGGMLSGYFLGG